MPYSRTGQPPGFFSAPVRCALLSRVGRTEAVVPVAPPVLRFHARYAAEASSIGVMRGEVAAVGHECGLRGDELADVRLVVSEAATKAVALASAGSPNSRVGVTVGLTDAMMLVDVTTSSAATAVHMSFAIPGADEALEACS